MIMHSIKAQFWSFDVIFAIVIFAVAITVLAFTWFNLNNQLTVSYGNGDVILQLQAHALETSIFSAGYPTNWQGSIDTQSSSYWSNYSIGLTTSPENSSLSSAKLLALQSMANYNYQAAKQPLGIGFDYFIWIKSNPVSGEAINVTIGRDPNKYGALTVDVEKRPGVLNGVPVQVEVMLWTNTTLATS